MMRMQVPLGALLFVLTMGCDRQADSVRDTVRSVRDTVHLKDAQINYEVAGSGKSVVLIHGWANNLRAWDDQFISLSDSFQVIRYDRRGFGRSTALPDITADPADLRDLLDTLGLSTAYLVGHSAGTEVALGFALAYPQRVAGIVLYGPGPLPGFDARPEEVGAFGDMPAIARRHGLDSLLKLLMMTPGFRLPPDRSDVAERIEEIWSAYSGRDLLEEYELSNRVPLPHMDQLKDVRAPTLILVGDEEWPLIARVSDSLLARIPGAKKVVVPGGGHIVHMLEPARFNAAVRAFLSDAGRALSR